MSVSIQVGSRVVFKIDALGIDGDPHPMRGVEALVVDRFGTTQAGFDCAVVLDITDLDFEQRLGFSVEEWRESVGSPDGEQPTIEAVCEGEHADIELLVTRITDQEKCSRLDAVASALREHGWSNRQIFYALKHGSPTTRNLVWDVAGSASKLVDALLSEACDKGPECGHSVCSQNYIDTGDNACISNEGNPDHG